MGNPLQRVFWEFWVNGVGSLNILPGKLRYVIYKIGGLKTESSKIRGKCTFRGTNIEIKKGAFLNHNVFIDCMEKVVIGKNAFIAFDTMIITSSHENGSSEQRAGQSQRKPVVIGDGCWIGARSTILPGVTIGNGCIIAAGSVVNKDCESNGVYAGVPARRIKDLP